jgi:hypothetical protein
MSESHHRWSIGIWTLSLTRPGRGNHNVYRSRCGDQSIQIYDLRISNGPFQRPVTPTTFEGWLGRKDLVNPQHQPTDRSPTATVGKLVSDRLLEATL